MQGQTVVITGATSGIGEVAADRLALKGARIVFIARDKARSEETLKHLHAIAPGVAHQAFNRSDADVRFLVTSVPPKMSCVLLLMVYLT